MQWQPVHAMPLTRGALEHGWRLTVEASSKRGMVFLKITVTIVLCYLILRSVDLTKFVETISRVKPVFLVLCCLLYPVSLAFAAIKLKWLLRGYQMPITARAAFDVNWIAGFFNNFLPSSIGGDVYRLIYLNRSFPDKPAQVVSAIILDRGLGLLAMLLLAGVTSTFFLGTFVQSNQTIAALYSGAVLIALVSFFVLFAPHNLRILHDTRWVIVNKIINGVNILISYPDKTALVRSLIISVLFLILAVISNWFLFLAFDRHVDIPILLFVIPLVSLAGMIPISINSLGVTEGAGIVLFRHFGYEPELILSIFLTARILLILCSATGGIRFLFRRNMI
jgi:uncharacterized protein (TIRG00374 family)